MKRFFFADNSNRRFVGPNNSRISFENIEEFAGSWRGVYATENPGEIEAMEKLSKTERTGVKEITEAEHAEWLQKKTRNSRDFQPSHLEV